jgi:hypothetical protein
VGTALKQAGNHVIFVAQIENQEDIYCEKELIHATDKILWLNNTENIIESLIKNHTEISLNNIDRIYLISHTDLLREFQLARKNQLKPYLLKDPSVIGAVYGNMQCMLKGVCAQCLQWQIDPETGLRTKAVFACSWQDQPLEIIDIDHMDARSLQNHLQDELSRLWVSHLFNSHDVTRALYITI